MFLKRLTLCGFKSFADPTDFDFDRGLTAIVGPNGCGKSNVVDAVRWVFGEQSAKSLRGSEMLDVIFNGTGSRKAMGMAEVTLLFVDCDGVLPDGGGEVAVTRRLYRSGESEYLINKTACRLRDVRNFLMDAGVGKEAYCVIEQGKIDVLLQANPQERRLVLEEAAGISRFKSRKVEAERRLERVQQNLLRLSDIIEEVEKQLRSVRTQAARARKYKDYRGELDGLKRALAARRYRRLEGMAREAAARAREAAEGVSIATTARLAAEAEASRVAEALLGARNVVRDHAAEQRAVVGELQLAQERIELGRKRLGELAEAGARAEAEVEALSRRIGEVEANLAAARADLDAGDRAVAERHQDLARFQEDAERVASCVGDTSRAAETAKAEVIEILQRETRFQNDLARVEAERKAAEDRGARIARRRETLAREMAASTATAEERGGQARLVEERRASLLAEAVQAGVEAARALAALHEVDEGLLRVTGERAGAAKGLEVLRDMERDLAGVDEGTRAVLEDAREGHGPQVAGLLGDLLSVVPGGEVALEAALGPLATALVAGSGEEAHEIVARLAKTGRGRATVLVGGGGQGRTRGARFRSGRRNRRAYLYRCRASRARGVSPSGDAGTLRLVGGAVTGPVRELVGADCPAALRAVIEPLVADTWVARDLGAALRLSERLPGLRFVTRDGGVAGPWPVLSGGAGGGTGRLVLRVRIEEGRQEVDALSVEETRLTERRDALRKERELWDARRKDLERQTREAEREGGRLRVEVERAQDAFRRSEEEAQLLALETEEVEDDLQGLGAREAEIEEERALLRGVLRQAEEEVERQMARLREAEEAARVVACEIGDRKAALGEARARREALEGAVRGLETDLLERERGVASARERAGEAIERADATRVDVAAAEAALGGLLDRKQGLEATGGKVVECARDLEQQDAGVRQELKTSLATEEEAREQATACKVAEREAVVHLESHRERTRDELGLDAVDLAAQETNDEVDEGAVAEQVRVLSGRLERLGNVNLDAIRDLEELEARHTWLAGQRDDLDRARGTLEEVIARVGAICRENLRRTYDEVRVNFQEIFRRLFDGGKADLLVEEDKDILEAGIEIVARPPGKEPKVLSLLSGGEKVLTTIALLFAIFQARPSPFCLLDEVDAALDESNVHRFTQILREFLSQSQFLIVSHNKHTMATADVLYGVTQQEAGVSRRVAVRLDEVAEVAAAGESEDAGVDPERRVA